MPLSNLRFTEPVFRSPYHGTWEPPEMREGSWDVGRRELECLRHEWVRETMVE